MKFKNELLLSKMQENHMVVEDVAIAMRENGCRTSVATILKWMRGKGSPSFEKIPALCKVFNLEFNDFIDNSLGDKNA